MTKKIHTDVEIDGTLTVGGEEIVVVDPTPEIFMLGGM